MSWYSNSKKDADTYGFPDMEIIDSRENASGISFGQEDPKKLIGYARIYQTMRKDLIQAQEENNLQKAKIISELLKDFVKDHGETLMVKDGPIGMPLTFYEDGSVG